jgi:hypothetical protein
MTEYRSFAPIKAKAEKRFRDVFIGCTELLRDSVIDGSPVTGAPGQPKQTGTLRLSWQPAWMGPLIWEFTTKLEYAKPIEDGVGPYGPLTLRSEVGGFHSVKLTRAGWPRIVENVTQRIVGQ